MIIVGENMNINIIHSKCVFVYDYCAKMCVIFVYKKHDKIHILALFFLFLLLHLSVIIFAFFPGFNEACKP